MIVSNIESRTSSTLVPLLLLLLVCSVLGYYLASNIVLEEFHVADKFRSHKIIIMTKVF